MKGTPAFILGFPGRLPALGCCSSAGKAATIKLPVNVSLRHDSIERVDSSLDRQEDGKCAVAGKPVHAADPLKASNGWRKNGKAP